VLRARVHTDALIGAGLEIEMIRAVGGGARIDKQMQLKANITELEVIKRNASESSAHGAPANAGDAMRVISHPSQAFAATMESEKHFLADEAALEKFDKAYKQYEKFTGIINNFEK